MNFNQRRACISEKLDNYTEELSYLRDAGPGYQAGFGFLLLVLFPALLLEILIVSIFGKDMGIFVPTRPVEPPQLVEAEVPDSLRDLIPLAKKFGVGDDADRGDIMKTASARELAELEAMVMPREQEISNWLDTFPETGISDTASFFLYLGSACDEVPLYKPEEEP
jgi:hypothetical protein